MEPDINGLKMKSLLNKSLSQFVVCTVVILILTIPLFYLLTKSFYAEEMRDVIHVMSQGKPLPPLDLEEDIMEGMTLQFVLIFIVLCLSLLLVMRFLTRRLWRPFDDTLQKIEHFNLENSDVPTFMPNDTKEFERLNRSVEQLMRKDKDTYNSQKEFTENASHELQTPIAVIQSKLDLLMQENLNRNQSELVADMYNICSRLSRLNKNLLLLAKIENSQFNMTEKIDLVHFINERIKIYKDLNIYGDVRLESTLKSMPISANVPLIESLVDNLVVNAMRHKPDHTDIIISIKEGALSVINNSYDKSPLDKSKIFTRFYNNGGRSHGNGLGLSIVKAICDFHHWSISYQYDRDNHIFTVKLNK